MLSDFGVLTPLGISPKQNWQQPGGKESTTERYQSSQWASSQWPGIQGWIFSAVPKSHLDFRLKYEALLGEKGQNSLQFSQLWSFVAAAVAAQAQEFWALDQDPFPLCWSDPVVRHQPALLCSRYPWASDKGAGDEAGTRGARFQPRHSNLGEQLFFSCFS